MPNNVTGTHSHNNQCQPIGRISEASMSTGTQGRNYQCQTKGHNLKGFNVNRDAGS